MWKKIKPEELTENVFQLMNEQWMLVGAQKDTTSVSGISESGMAASPASARVNAMTASWGGLGILWNKRVAFVFVRPQRYTKEFIDGSDKMSLSFFGESSRRMLNYMGTVSGRDEDKIAKCGLKVEIVDGAPVFDESRMVMICRKLYEQEMKEDCFLDRKPVDQFFAAGDYHIMYVVEIEKILMRD